MALHLWSEKCQKMHLKKLNLNVSSQKTLFLKIVHRSYLEQFPVGTTLFLLNNTVSLSRRKWHLLIDERLAK